MTPTLISLEQFRFLENIYQELFKVCILKTSSDFTPMPFNGEENKIPPEWSQKNNPPPLKALLSLSPESLLSDITVYNGGSCFCGSPPAVVLTQLPIVLSWEDTLVPPDSSNWPPLTLLWCSRGCLNLFSNVIYYCPVHRVLGLSNSQFLLCSRQTGSGIH